MLERFFPKANTKAGGRQKMPQDPTEKWPTEYFHCHCYLDASYDCVNLGSWYAGIHSFPNEVVSCLCAFTQTVSFPDVLLFSPSTGNSYSSFKCYHLEAFPDHLSLLLVESLPFCHFLALLCFHYVCHSTSSLWWTCLSASTK